MSIMIDFPPAMAAEVKEYAMDCGTTMQQVIFDCLRRELERKRESDEVYSYLMNQNGWLPDNYVFSREEANAK